MDSDYRASFNLGVWLHEDRVVAKVFGAPAEVRFAVKSEISNNSYAGLISCPNDAVASVAEFSGERLTTEGRALRLRAADRKIGLLRRVVNCLSD